MRVGLNSQQTALVVDWFGPDWSPGTELLKQRGHKLMRKERPASGFFMPADESLVVLFELGPPAPDHVELLARLRGRNCLITVITSVTAENSWVDLGPDFVISSTRNEGRMQQFSAIVRLHEDRSKLLQEQQQRKRSEEELSLTVENLESASRRFEALFNGLPVACFTIDTEGQIQEWNSASARVFGIEGWQVFMRPASDVFTKRSRGRIVPVIGKRALARIFKNAEPLTFDWDFTRPDGRRVYLACEIVPLKNRYGKVTAAVVGNLDITDRVLNAKQIAKQMTQIKRHHSAAKRSKANLQRLNRQLTAQSETDPLTGVMNRRRFNALLEETLDRSKRENRPFSLLMLDIDHFKQLNDHFGHQAGDEILIQFARLLASTGRRYERPARYGGEEFAIILENCNPDQARRTSARFLTAIRSASWPFRDVTASIGCATYIPGETIREFVERADQALYASKHAGRNRATHANDLVAAA